MGSMAALIRFYLTNTELNFSGFICIFKIGILF
jgi:hypothetical protein